jgi:hypothetical protein
MLSAKKLTATVFWDRKDGGIHGTRDHNNFINVLRNTKKCAGLFRIKVEC